MLAVRRWRSAVGGDRLSRRLVFGTNFYVASEQLELNATLDSVKVTP